MSKSAEAWIASQVDEIDIEILKEIEMNEMEELSNQKMSTLQKSWKAFY